MEYRIRSVMELTPLFQMMCQTNGTDASYPQGQGNGQQDLMERNTYLRDGTDTNTQVVTCYSLALNWVLDGFRSNFHQ